MYTKLYHLSIETYGFGDPTFSEAPKKGGVHSGGTPMTMDGPKMSQ